MKNESDNLEKRVDFSHYGGRASGFEDSALFLKKLAGEAFIHGNDNRANILREVADSLKKFAEDMRKEQKKFE